MYFIKENIVLVYKEHGLWGPANLDIYTNFDIY